MTIETKIPSLGNRRVYRVNNTIFIPLPKELHQPFADADPETGLGPCCCRYCSTERGASQKRGAWDTLAVTAVKMRGSPRETTWMVHAPEYHGRKPLRPAD